MKKSFLKIGIIVLAFFTLVGCAESNVKKGIDIRVSEQSFEQDIVPKKTVLTMTVSETVFGLVISPETVALIGNDALAAFAKNGWREVTDDDGDVLVDITCYLDSKDNTVAAQCETDVDVRFDGHNTVPVLAYDSMSAASLGSRKFSEAIVGLVMDQAAAVIQTADEIIKDSMEQKKEKK
ncbi:MAG: hypothetical protein PHT88_03645 [Candidatus Moranbacteria bacterium]|nr:hypothetical protein [Candidatus Moranbacteria bacterium]